MLKLYSSVYDYERLRNSSSYQRLISYFYFNGRVLITNIFKAVLLAVLHEYFGDKSSTVQYIHYT